MAVRTENAPQQKDFKGYHPSVDPIKSFRSPFITVTELIHKSWRGWSSILTFDPDSGHHEGTFKL